MLGDRKIFKTNARVVAASLKHECECMRRIVAPPCRQALQHWSTRPIICVLVSVSRLLSSFTCIRSLAGEFSDSVMKNF